MAEYDAASRKKLWHNANERDRRKKLNALYSQLQLLIPNINTKGKLYNPTVVCGALNYIPQLLSQIKELRRQRDELLTTKRISESSIFNVAGAECHTDLFQYSAHRNSPVITVNRGFGRSLAISINTCNVSGLVFSTLLLLLEQEGMEVLNASKFVAGENLCYTLHLQMTAGRCNFDTAVLRNKIMFLWLSCENRQEI